MFAARTGPDEAISNLSKWLRYCRVEPGSWISNRSIDRWATFVAMGLLVSGVVVFLAWINQPVEHASPHKWAALSSSEILELRSKMRAMPKPAGTAIICGDENCRDLADGLGSLLSGLGWQVEQSYSSPGIRGITIMQPLENPGLANSIAESIEKITNGRIKINIEDAPGLHVLWIEIGFKG
jgi:hypothetical protein